MNINQLRESKYLKKEDVGPGALVTIYGLKQDNVAKEGAEPEMKWIMYFDEFEKGLVMNSTNAQLAAKALNSEETDDWIGKQIVLFHDPNVSFAGKIMGGIRIRARKVKPQATPAAASAPAPASAQPTHGVMGKPVNRARTEELAEPAIPDPDDDVPF